MGLFDKIKDNAKTISVRAIEEADADYTVPAQNAGSTIKPNPSYPEDTLASPQASEEAVHEITEEDFDEPTPERDAFVENAPSEVEEQPELTPEPEAAPEPETPEEPEPTEKAPKEAAKKPEPTPVADTPKPETKPDKPERKPEPSKPSGKPYTPFYKQTRTMANKSGKVTRVIDISPQPKPDSEKRVVYERERAIMATLASQRRLDGSSPLYVTNHLRFKTRVFINRIEYSGSFGKNVIPVENVAWIKLRAGGTGVILESTDGKRIVMVIKPADRLNFADAILKVQSMLPKKAKFKDTKTVRLDQLDQMEEGIDELEKLARLLDKGILTQEEFDTKKKQILGI